MRKYLAVNIDHGSLGIVHLVGITKKISSNNFYANYMVKIVGNGYAYPWTRVTKFKLFPSLMLTINASFFIVNSSDEMWKIETRYIVTAVQETPKQTQKSKMRSSWVLILESFLNEFKRKRAKRSGKEPVSVESLWFSFS